MKMVHIMLECRRIVCISKFFVRILIVFAQIRWYKKIEKLRDCGRLIWEKRESRASGYVYAAGRRFLRFGTHNVNDRAVAVFDDPNDALALRNRTGLAAKLLGLFA